MQSENNKRIAKNTIILYIRMLFTIVVGLYTSRVILNTLGITDYGINNVVGGIITMFTFFSSSMSGSSSRFITFELGTGNDEKLKRIFGQSISIHIIIAIIIFIIGETIGLWFIYEKVQIPSERLSAALIVYHFSVLSSVLSVLSIPYNSAIIAHEKMSAFAYITILDVIFRLIIVYLLVIIPYDKLIVYAILLFIVQIINQAIYILYSWRKFDETKTLPSWDKTLSKEMFSFAGWSMFGNLAAVLFGQGLNILLNIFFGPTVNAARGIAVQVQGVIGRFIGNFQTALNPQITKRYAAGELDSMHKLIYTSSRFSFFLMMFISIPVLINTEYILTIWLKMIPEHTVIFVRIILLISLNGTLSNPIIISSLATGKIRVYQQAVGGILLAILPVSFIALKLGAPAYVVFLIHLVFDLIAQVVRIYIISPMIKLKIKNYICEVVVKVYSVFCLSMVSSYLFSRIHNYVNSIYFIYQSLLCVIISAFFIYIIGLNKGEKEFIKSKIIVLKNKFR